MIESGKTGLSMFNLYGQVPAGLYDDKGQAINKGNIYISESSPPLVSQAYFMQFKEDFSLFLPLRSQELTTGGCMHGLDLVGKNRHRSRRSRKFILLATSFKISRSFGSQKKASDMVKHITIHAVEEVYLALKLKSLEIADLGCSSGPNSLSNIKAMVEAIEAISNERKTPLPEFRVYLNDLPTNDFNSVFKSLPEFYSDLKKERNGGCPSVYIVGSPGSFYTRLFPTNSLHFVYSSYSLHWLSKVPAGLFDDKGQAINKGNIYISESSPPLVSQAYFMQFKEDFSLFLRLRSQELTTGGCIVLILLGRIGPDHVDRGNSFFWQLLSRSLAVLVSQGEIEQQKLDTYDVHFYAPSKEEIEAEIRREGSFELVQMEMFETEKECDKVDGKYGAEVAMTVRAIQESMICHHFGDGILDNLFKIWKDGR